MLYELSSRYKELIARYNEVETQEELDAILAELETIDETLEDKAEQIVKAIRNYEGEAAEAKMEKEFFAAKEMSAKQRGTKLDERFSSMLTATGIKEIKAGKFKYSIVNNGGKASVLCTIPIEKVPKEFKKFIPSDWEINNDAIREAEKAGKKLPDGIKVERGTHSVIK